jgi:hypothetical protein
MSAVLSDFHDWSREHWASTSDERDERRDGYIVDMMGELRGLGRQLVTNRKDRILQSEAMEEVLDYMGQNDRRQEEFERTLIEIWSRLEAGPDSSVRRMAGLIGVGIDVFCQKKSREVYP